MVAIRANLMHRTLSIISKLTYIEIKLHIIKGLSITPVSLVLDKDIMMGPSHTKRNKIW